MTRILLGFFYALIASIFLSLLASLFICYGVDPEARTVSDTVVPLMGIFTGAWFSSRNRSWRIGFGTGLAYVTAWLIFWFYVMGRWNPLLWIEEGLPRLTGEHLLWWGAAVVAGACGGWASQWRLRVLVVILLTGCISLLLVMVEHDKGPNSLKVEIQSGFEVDRVAALADQTVVYSLTFDFAKQPQFKVGLYDCDSDDARPGDDSNTTYMGQTLGGLVHKLNAQASANRQQMLCVANGGFFGASGCAVAHHEEPIVESGVAHYDVDLLRPKDQGWYLMVNSLTSVQAGRPRFSMMPSPRWEMLGNYDTVLGGVRPLRFDGNSIPLKPGAGATTLKCSRTSVGWSTDGMKFYVLIVHDPESEGASQMQRKMGWVHEGGWDVHDVQKYWEQKGVPYALLFDGGESTQLAYRQADSAYHLVASGYQYSYTLGYLFHRPLLATLPTLPPSEGHRGVLNYFYVQVPVVR